MSRAGPRSMINGLGTGWTAKGLAHFPFQFRSCCKMESRMS
jgi:hypothetical protein